MNEKHSRPFGDDVFAWCVMVVTMVVCFWPLVLHPSELLVGVQRNGLNDLISWYLPRREYPLQTLTRFGQLPFWNPWVAGGSPFVGSFQTAIFYPPNWAFWVVPARGLISWDLVVHHLIAAAGAYRLSRRLGAARLGAAFASLAYGASPILMARTGEGHLTIINTVAWYPWAFLAYEGFRESRRWSTIAMVGVLALGFLAGHLQEFYHLVLALSVLCLFDTAWCLLNGRSRDGLRLSLRWGMAGVVAAGLVAAELIPLAIYLTHASAGARLRSAMPVSPGPANLLQLILPFVMGGPASYRGPGTYFWETICYFGLVPVGLAALGAATSLGPRKPVGRIAVVGLVSFALGFGEATPLHGMAAWLPGYASLRCPGRWLLMSALAVAVLAAFGVDDFARPRIGRVGRWKWLVPIVLAAIAAMGVLVLWLYLQSLVLSQGGQGARSLLPFGRTDDWMFAAPLLASLVGLGCAWLCRSRPEHSKVYAAMLLPIAVAELAVFANAILATIPPESFPRDNPLPGLIANRADGTRIFSTQFAFSDGESFRHGLAKFQGYEPLPLDRTIRFTSVMLNPDYPLSNLEGFYKLEVKRAPMSLLNLWGVRHLVAMERDELPGQATDWTSLGQYRLTWLTTPRGRPPGRLTCRVWENAGALPRGFVVGRVRTSSGAETESEVLHGLDPRNEVVLERDVLPAGPRQEFVAARRIEDTPNRVALEVETQHPGYLVLADTWYPGWMATLDGDPTPVLHADITFRAVALPTPGKHQVVFNYFPPGLIAGLAVSAATAAGLAMYAARLARDRGLSNSPS